MAPQSTHMNIEVTRVTARQILPLRELHREEMGCQIVHDSLHERGLTHPYLLRVDGEDVGYGTVFGLGEEPKETVDELFVLREHRGAALALFTALVEASSATRIQAQTNDALLTLMLYDFAERIERDRILFEDGFTSSLKAPGLTFRRATSSDRGRAIDGKKLSEAGDWLLENGDEIVGAGGILFHYNPPYGSFLVQELKRACYEIGKVPVARCDAANVASRATLQKAGMLPCGGILIGEIRPEVAGGGAGA